MAHYNTYLGLDKLGMIYDAQAALLYRELGLHDNSHLAIANEGSFDTKYNEARLVTAWGMAFASSTFHATSQRATALIPPIVARPSGDAESEVSPWIPYPIASVSLMANESHQFDLRCDLVGISVRMQNTVFRNQDQLSGPEMQEAAKCFAKEFGEWHANVMESGDGTIQPPTHSITMRYLASPHHDFPAC